ncbi:MAG: hypothetical protein ACOC84_03060 [Actinomycetota bacterium]
MHPIRLARLDETRPVLVRPLGALLEERGHDVTRAFHEAFDLED